MKFNPSLISILVLLVLPSTVNAQLDSLASPTYRLSYFGNNLWNEGLNAGVEYPQLKITKNNKKGKQRTITKSRSANVNFYHDNGSHSALFITMGWSKRKVFPNRFNFTSSAEPIGLYRSFLPETYKVKDDGSIKKVFLPGRFYLAPSLSAGFGRVGKLRPENGWYARVNLTTLMPYNRSIMPLVNVEFGYHFKLNNGKK